jgi:hypothetical protein
MGNQGAQGKTGFVGPTGPSDIRFKKNIRNIETPLAKVLKMRGVSFIWKKPADTIDKTEASDIGFVAQELERTVPELVFSEDKKTHLKKVKYYEIISLCIEAIKEQDVELIESENRLEYLENRIKEKGLI